MSALCYCAAYWYVLWFTHRPLFGDSVREGKGHRLTMSVNVTWRTAPPVPYHNDHQVYFWKSPLNASIQANLR